MSAPDPVADALLEDARTAGAPRARFWEPTHELVVLGRGNDPELECDLERCRERGVPILRRRGGGGTVLLAPGMLVLTMAGPVGTTVRPKRVFAAANAWVADVLAEIGVPPLEQRGTSDLCLGDRKVLGCSLAFSRGFALYQGVLLVDSPLAPLADLLRHPSREPDYRGGRPHLEFVTTLAAAGIRADLSELAARFRAEFDRTTPFQPATRAADSAAPGAHAGLLP